MNALAPINPWNERQLALVKKTVAKDCDRDSKGNPLHLGEFDWFMSICRSFRLDPLRRQIYAFVFNKDKPAYRQMVPVVAISGYRTIADRTGNYRPDDALPTFIYDETKKDPLANPKGLVKAVVKVWKHAHGEWFPVPAEALWEAYAPLIEDCLEGYTYEETGETWEDSGKPKKKRVPKGKLVQKLDPNKDRWRIDGEGMLAKCAEALALRKAWPDDFAGTYVEGELDRAEVLDLTATEMAEAAETTKRLEQIGGGNQILIDWLDGKSLAPVPVGKLGDAALEFIGKHKDQPATILAWEDRNRFGLREYWARDKDGALTVKSEVDKYRNVQPVAEAAE